MLVLTQRSTRYKISETESVQVNEIKWKHKDLFPEQSGNKQDYLIHFLHVYHFTD